MHGHAHARVGQGRYGHADEQAEKEQHGAPDQELLRYGSHGISPQAYVVAGKIMQVSVPWASSFPRSSRSQPSLVAVRLPRWINLPSQRTMPLVGSTGRTKWIFISSVV